MEHDIPREASMLLVPLLATVVVTQGFPRFDSVPDLAIGQRVRVSFPVAAPPVPMFHSGFRVGTVAGKLVGYRPRESIAVRRSGWIAGIGPQHDRSFDWVEITRIDVAQPRNALNAIQGAAGGYLASMMLAFGAKYLGMCWAGREDPCDSWWSITNDIAVVMVPVGAVVGLASTRWKPVYYRRHVLQL